MDNMWIIAIIPSGSGIFISSLPVVSQYMNTGKPNHRSAQTIGHRKLK